MPNLFISKQGTLVERGTADNQWIIGNGSVQLVYLKANQPNFDPYIVFDPETSKWYAVGSTADDAAFKAGTLSDLNATGGGGGGSATGPAGAIQISDGAGGFDGNSTLTYSMGSLGVDSIPSGTCTIDLANGRVLISGIDAVTWASRSLIDAAGETSANWDNRSLHDDNGDISGNWNDRQLTEGAGVTVNWGNQSLLKNGVVSIDWGGGVIYDINAGQAAINWDYRLLVTANGVDHSLNWNTCELKRPGGAVTVNWNNQYLSNENGETAFSWDPSMMANTTAARPVGLLAVGFVYFDTTLNAPIWWTGTGWVDAWGVMA